MCTDTRGGDKELGCLWPSGCGTESHGRGHSLHMGTHCGEGQVEVGASGQLEKKRGGRGLPWGAPGERSSRVPEMLWFMGGFEEKCKAEGESQTLESGERAASLPRLRPRGHRRVAAAWDEMAEAQAWTVRGVLVSLGLPLCLRLSPGDPWRQLHGTPGVPWGRAALGSSAGSRPRPACKGSHRRPLEPWSPLPASPHPPQEEQCQVR